MQRRWTSLKAVWIQDKVTKSKKCLEEIMQIVSLAELMYQSETQERNTRVLMQGIDDFQAQQKLSFEKINFVASCIEANQTPQPLNDSTRSTDLGPLVDQAVCKALKNPEMQDSLKLVFTGSDLLPRDRRGSQSDPRLGLASSSQDPVAVAKKASEDASLSSTVSTPYIRRTTVQRDNQQYALALAKIYYHTRLNHVHFVDEAQGAYESDLDDQQEVEVSVTVHPNRWLFSRGFSISYSHYGQGWIPNIRFRQFNLISEESLIFSFCSSGNIDGVRLLLARGEASPFDTDGEGWTPLHFAAAAGRSALCKLLIHMGASGDSVTLSNTYNFRSPLYLVLDPSSGPSDNRSNNSEISISSTVESTLRVLVGSGQANPSIKTDEGLTCYDLIRSERMGGSTALLIWLLRETSFDFDPNHRDHLGQALLMRFAVSTLASDTLDLLLSLGADINARVTETEDADPRSIGTTALHFAASPILRLNAATATTKQLLSRGADPHILSANGESPTHI
ncbi:MAG: hypothetical protein M1835_002634, partial [Candelina submexicana]